MTFGDEEEDSQSSPLLSDGSAVAATSWDALEAGGGQETASKEEARVVALERSFRSSSEALAQVELHLRCIGLR